MVSFGGFCVELDLVNLARCGCPTLCEQWVMMNSEGSASIGGSGGAGGMFGGLGRGPIVLATQNPHKVEELRAILSSVGGGGCEGGGLGVEVIGLGDLSGRGVAVDGDGGESGDGGGFAEPEECGTTFAQNAAIKALSYARMTGHLCLADDSGLEVDALGGAPGVISSHYNTDGEERGQDRATRDRLNNERLLRELRGVPFEERGARFVCVMVLALPPGKLSPNGRVLAEVRGSFEGRIGVCAEELGEKGEISLVVPRGAFGFGYDPLFLVGPGFERTSAELSGDEKNLLSHRAAAAKKLAVMLRGMM